MSEENFISDLIGFFLISEFIVFRKKFFYNLVEHDRNDQKL